MVVAAVKDVGEIRRGSAGEGEKRGRIRMRPVNAGIFLMY
jgi:hypothetical protein